MRKFKNNISVQLTKDNNSFFVRIFESGTHIMDISVVLLWNRPVIIASNLNMNKVKPLIVGNVDSGYLVIFSGIFKELLFSKPGIDTPLGQYYVVLHARENFGEIFKMTLDDKDRSVVLSMPCKLNYQFDFTSLSMVKELAFPKKLKEV